VKMEDIGRLCLGDKELLGALAASLTLDYESLNDSQRRSARALSDYGCVERDYQVTVRLTDEGYRVLSALA